MVDKVVYDKFLEMQEKLIEAAKLVAQYSIDNNLNVDLGYLLENAVGYEKFHGQPEDWDYSDNTSAYNSWNSSDSCW